MNKIQENKLSMYMVVEKSCKENVEIWNSFEAFGESVSDLSNVIKSLQSTRQLQEMNYKGVCEDKHYVISQLVDLAVCHISALKVFAHMNNEKELLRKISFSRTQLIDSRDTALLNKCELVYNTAKQCSEGIVKYGITKKHLAKFKYELENLRGTFTGSVEAKNLRKISTSKIKALVKKADEILKHQLDNLIVMFKYEHENFYNTYQASRKIIHSGIRHNAATSEKVESNFISQAA